MGLPRSLSSCVAVLAMVAGPWPEAQASDAAPVPAGISQSSAYARVLASVKGNLCDFAGKARGSMMVSNAGLAAGFPVYVISSRISGSKCGEGEIAAVVADGRGGYRTALITVGDELDILPGGRASVGRGFVGDPGVTQIAYRYDGAVYRKTAACSYVDLFGTLAFAAGASSGTVTGALEQDMSTTYDLYARSGQAISVEVHGVPRDVQVSITDRLCGNVVTSKAGSLSGRLPSSGEYFVTVKLPRNARDRKIYTYSMTVSII